MLFGIFFYTFSVLSLDESETLPAVEISVDIENEKVREITNTILYEIAETEFWTNTVINGKPVETKTKGKHITYIPTILHFLKARDILPTSTPPVDPPPATQARKHFLLHPGILIGCTFGIVFIVGVFYTSCCRKPQQVRRPQARKVVKGNNSRKSQNTKGNSQSAGGATRKSRNDSGRSASSGRGSQGQLQRSPNPGNNSSRGKARM
ncbi:hypothetical protein TRFO_05237 [Tritrichomonas foetus]|uniref:Uncharacterized protein n=1 Tax=Tritrichomonas foetus TaxID=1144522 RepID=A0A1J4K851_9EUKA|nr:hypothetical protein TRFO_05237 [Tritrichomonas foetus]|eukprot:OHT07583.1 hypothetical protein TRFO_05237 [Tritrichomonas foetus]